MRLGIAIPNRNHGRVIGRLLDDIVPQSPDEIVVVDAASDDDSREVVSRYDSVRLICHRQKLPEHNVTLGEVASSMNVDYITFAGADDRLYPGFVDEIRRNEGGGVIFCDYDIVDDQSRLITTRSCGFPQTTTLSPAQARERLASAGLGLFECGVGAAVRKDAHEWLSQRGGYAMGPWIDSVGNAILACIFGAVYVPKRLAAFTLSSSGINWHVQVAADAAKADGYRKSILDFLSHPEVSVLGPQLLSAIATRWGA